MDLTSLEWENLYDLDRLVPQQSWTNSAWEEAKKAGRNYYLAVIVENSIWKGLSLFYRPSVEEKVHLLKIIVHPESRRRGLGKNLLEFAIKKWRDEMVCSLFLEVAENNGPALGLYRLQGFRALRLVARFYSDGTNAWRMELPLNNA